MRFAITIVNALALALGAAAFDSSPVQDKDCPAVVDVAIAAAVSTLRVDLKAVVLVNLDVAIDAGVACLKVKIGCADEKKPPAMRDAQMNMIDCSGTIDAALASAVVTLKTNLGPNAPANLQVGVDAGLVCFKKALGCVPK